MQRLPNLIFMLLSADTLSAAEPVAIGTRREFFFDVALSSGSRAERSFACNSRRRATSPSSPASRGKGMRPTM
jgi:hypothetical protein